MNSWISKAVSAASGKEVAVKAVAVAAKAGLDGVCVYSLEDIRKCRKAVQSYKAVLVADQGLK